MGVIFACVMFKKLASGVLACIISGCSGLNDSRFDSGLNSGYSFGRYDGVQTNISASFKVNDWVGLDAECGDLYFGVESFYKQYLSSNADFLVGTTPLSRYSYPVGFGQVYVEAGAGPAYLNMKTREQGSAGFNFFDQVGAGVSFSADNLSVRLGYRFSHISHAGLRDGSNGGIDAHSILFGFSLNY